MSDMLSMISAEPATTVASDKTGGKSSAKTAGKADSDKSFEQLLPKEDLPQELQEAESQPVDVAADVDISDAAIMDLDDAEPVDPAVEGSEPVVVFSVAHAALQASLDGTGPAQMLAEQPVLGDAAPNLPPDQTAEAPLLPALTADETDTALGEDMLPAAPRIDPAPARPLMAADNSGPAPVVAADAPPLADSIIAPQSQENEAAPAPDVADEIKLVQAPKGDAKQALVPVQDALAVQNAQPDDQQAVTPLTPLQAKEAASFEKLVAQAALAPTATDEKPVASPLVRNILDRMQELDVSEGKTRILLRPQGMGALEIDILRQADGRMHLAIRVENPLVLDALRNESGALSSFMGEKGFDLSNGGPDLSSYRQTSQGDDAGAEEEADPTETGTALLDGERVNILT